MKLRIKIVALISTILFSSPALTMEAPDTITVYAELHYMLQTSEASGIGINIPKVNIMLQGKPQETLKTVIRRALKKNKQQCKDFDISQGRLDNNSTLAEVARTLGDDNNLIIQCWGSNKQIEKIKEEAQLKDPITIRIEIEGKEPINTSLELDSEQTFKEAITQALTHRGFTDYTLKSIKIGTKTIRRKNNFLQKSLQKIKKEAGKNTIILKYTSSK